MAFAPLKPGDFGFEPTCLAEALFHACAVGGWGETPTTTPENVARARKFADVRLRRGGVIG